MPPQSTHSASGLAFDRTSRDFPKASRQLTVGRSFSMNLRDLLWARSSSSNLATSCNSASSPVACRQRACSSSGSFLRNSETARWNGSVVGVLAKTNQIPNLRARDRTYRGVFTAAKAITNAFARNFQHHLALCNRTCWKLVKKRVVVSSA